MIIVIGGIKGGCGKSTIATNLTVMRASEDRRVLLIDADEQKSTSNWALQREISGYHTPWTTIQLAGETIGIQVKKMARDYDDIIIDAGGRDTTTQRGAMLVANKFIVPFQPRSLDIWTIPDLRRMIAEVMLSNSNMQSYALINSADSTGRENQGSIEILKECRFINYLPVLIGRRKAFATAATEGQAVIELKPVDKKAIAEIESLYHYVFDKIEQ
jgi:chromosome partitioning protein